MIDWFDVNEEGKVFIDPAVLMHPVFDRLFSLHGTNGLLVVWYMAYPVKNPYWTIPHVDRIERLQSEFYMFDQITENAIQLFTEMIAGVSASYALLYKAKNTAERALRFLETVDFSAETKTGHMKYKPGEISKAIRELQIDLKNIDDLQKRVSEDIKAPAIGRKGRIVGLFENPVNIQRLPLGHNGHTQS